MATNPNINHTDAMTPLSAEDDGNSVDISYQQHPEKTDYGSVARRGSAIKLRHPAEDIATLHQTAHLTAQLHESNRQYWKEHTDLENDGTTLYDLAVLDVAETALEVEEITPSALSIPTRRLKLLFLKHAREIEEVSTLRRYVQANPRTCTALGYNAVDDIPSYDTLHAELETRLPDKVVAALNHASTRAAYAAFRNGVQPPRSVSEVFGFEPLRPPLYERDVCYKHRQQALRNWIRLLQTETLDPLTFDRTDPDFNIFQLLGLFAASALTNSGFQSAASVAAWDFERSSFPKGSGIPKHISGLSYSDGDSSAGRLPRINKQFDAVHANTLAVANEHGFFSDPVRVAVDGFRIEWTGSDEAPTINRPLKGRNDVRSEWTFLIAGIIDTEARFTLGTRWIAKKSSFPEMTRPLLAQGSDLFDISAVFADKEFASGGMFDVFRNVAGDDMVVKAPDDRTMKTLRRVTPRNHVGFLSSVPWNCSPKPNVVAFPKDASQPETIDFTSVDLARLDQPEPSITQTSLSDPTAETVDNGNSKQKPGYDDVHGLREMDGFGTASTHNAYFTYRTLPGRSAGGIHYPYYQRWAVEEAVNQVKHDFKPVGQSQLPSHRLYGMNVSILFQNWHTLINRAPSPQLKLRLDITHAELLKAIQHVAFTPRR